MGLLTTLDIHAAMAPRSRLSTKPNLSFSFVYEARKETLAKIVLLILLTRRLGQSRPLPSTDRYLSIHVNCMWVWVCWSLIGIPRGLPDSWQECRCRASGITTTRTEVRRAKGVEFFLGCGLALEHSLMTSRSFHVLYYCVAVLRDS